MKISKVIMLLVLTAIIFTGIGVYATIKIQADEIGYKDGTVEDAINDLYTTQSTTVSNLQTELNSYKSKFDELTFTFYAQSYNNASNSNAGILLDDFDNIFNYFEINRVFNYKGDGSCTLVAWNRSTSNGDLISINTRYNISDYANLYIRTKSTSSSEYACRVELTLYK